MAPRVLHLRTARADAVAIVDAGAPEVVYLGPPLGATPDASHLTRGVPPAGLDAPAGPTVITEASRGWFGEPGIEVLRDGRPCAVQLGLAECDAGRSEARVRLVDDAHGIEVTVHLALADSGVLAVSARLANRGTTPLEVAALGCTVPAPDDADEIMTLGGRWAMEFCEDRRRWGRSVQTVTSRQGRTSHQQSPTVFVGAPGFGENHGRVRGFHLAWHGGHRIVCDAVTGDRRTISAHAALGRADVVLAPGETHATPDLLVAASDEGLTGVMRAFHAHLRSVSPPTPRPVIVNTWEAVYFDHDRDKLSELARRAARCGAERFVLDDGWFRGRRHDRAGLGDWRVDPDVWPDGLGPLVELVRGLGMDFGLWVEPEMVNPDSDLCRTHPDWVLGEERQHDLVGRNQLVLDLSRTDVRDHLVAVLSGLLDSHDIAHLKWDHNRDVVTLRPHSQAAGLDDVISRVRAAHPHVTIESCASGGGRIDAGIARHASRFWTSDSIDALDRLSIGRGAVRVVPPEMLGAHVGAPTCHLTGRRHRLAFRVLSALPWWLGIEWNLLEATEDELDRLAAAVAVHKRFRALLHSADTVFADHPDPEMHVHLAVAADAREALAVVARRGNGPRHDSAPILLPGLDPSRIYSVNLVDLGVSHWAAHRRLPEWLVAPTTISGSQLECIGLPAPPLLPASGIAVHLEAVS